MNTDHQSLDAETKKPSEPPSTVAAISKIETSMKISKSDPMDLSDIMLYDDAPYIDSPIKKNREDVCELHELIEMLKYGYRSSPYNFEAHYLKHFSDNPFPGETFVPKKILSTLLEKHANNHKMIKEKKILLKTVAYRYTFKGETCKFKFHNDMDLADDLLIILYLHLFITKLALSTHPVKTLLDIFHIKYNLQRASDFKEQWRVPEPGYEKPITINSVIHVFPSIVISMFERNLGYIAKISQIIFKEVSDLPQAIYHHMIAAIIPHDVKNPPIALLVFIMKKYMFYFDKEELQVPLKMLYDRVMSLYESNVYPLDLKRKLCKCWGIVEQHENEIDFSAAIVNANKYVKNMIATMMIDDPDLEDILSKI